MHIQEYIRESSSPDRKASFNKPVEGEGPSSSQFETRLVHFSIPLVALSSSFSKNRVSSLSFSSLFFSFPFFFTNVWEWFISRPFSSSLLCSSSLFHSFRLHGLAFYASTRAGILIREPPLYRNYHFYPSPLIPPLYSSHRNSLKSREYSRVTRGTFLLREDSSPHPLRRGKNSGKKKEGEEEEEAGKEERSGLVGKISSAAWSSRQSNLLLASYLGSRCNARSQLLLIA